MKTLELIRASEAQLAPMLKDMKLKELEKHGENLVRILGGGNGYAEVLRQGIKAIPTLEPGADRFAALQSLLRPQLKLSNEQPDILAKLTVILSLVIAHKFRAIHDGR